MGAPNLLQISALNDIHPGRFTGAAMVSGDDVCVFSNNGGYNVTASDDGAGGAFELTGASLGEAIAYKPAWATLAGATTGTALSPDAPLTGLSGTFTNLAGQSGAQLNTRVLIDVTSETLSEAPAADHSGSLTLTVEPPGMMNL